MNLLRRLLCLLACAVIFAGPLHAADNAKAQAPKPVVAEKSTTAVNALATTISTVTGVAISPLLGTASLGAYKYFTAGDTPEAKAALPWYAQLSFWLPALLVVGVCAFKDSIAAVVPPGMKKPLDVLETMENKLSGLVAAGAVVPFTIDSVSKLLVADVQGQGPISSGLATITLGAIDMSWLINLLTIPFGVAVFAVVWMASHAINVLILLSPWGAVDTFLKGARTALLGLITLTATLNPWISAALSIVVIVVSYLVAGWAFRLTVFGSVFCWDFFTRRKGRYDPSVASNWLFSGSLLCRLGVPVRTYGILSNADAKGSGSAWIFSYRPWLLGARKELRVEPESCELGKGLFISAIKDKDGNLFILPPRYRDHEEALVQLYAIAGGIKPAGLLKAWSALRELFAGNKVNRQSA